MEFVLNDGGRKDCGYQGTAGDCVVRSIAIAVGVPYGKVYDDLYALNRLRNKNPQKCSPRDGNTKMLTIREYLASRYGWRWEPTMTIGSGCKVHMRPDELPKGRIIVRLSGHLAAVINGVLHDTHDCTRDGTRCVYGFFYDPKQNDVTDCLT